MKKLLEVKIPNSDNHVAIYFRGEIERVELWPDPSLKGYKPALVCEDVVEEVVE
jgi:hypothetical protein